jgi:acetyl-CoA C-acetyltransferase
MRQAVIVSTARTPLAKSHRGEFNATPGPTLAAFSVKAAVERAGIDPALIEDHDGLRLPRRHHRPQHWPPDRACAPACRCRWRAPPSAVFVPRACRPLPWRQTASWPKACPPWWPGVESISAIRAGLPADIDPWLVEHKPDLYMAMIDTADNVAHRYGISREDQDLFSLESQQRTAAAQARACLPTRSCPVPHHHGRKEQGHRRSHLARRGGHRDNCNRPGTTLEGLAKLEPVKGPGQFITAGNASQLSDGSSACVLMEAAEAERLGLHPWAPSAVLPWPAASPTKWASARCLPCPSCWRATASRWKTSTCGR